MSKILLAIKLFIIGTFLVLSCSKKAPAPSPTPQEAALVFTLNPDPGSTVLAALGATQNFNISVTSTLPSAGINASVLVVKELDGATVFSQSLTSNMANFTTSIQNLQNGVVCNVTITLTSRSSATNTVTKTFKIVRK
jgi:hypothetical protein